MATSYFPSLRYFMNNIIIIRKLSTVSTPTETLKFVPKHNPVSEANINNVQSFINNSKKMLFLTGAGISTESGIPDYRSEEVGLYARTNHKPIQHMEFIKYPHVQKRYWARNFVGWTTFSKREPNIIHYSICELEKEKISTVVTQNVDNLHYKAGSQNVIELHGTAFRVICLKCEAFYDRHYIQERLIQLNSHITPTSTTIRPDGDVDIPLEIIEGFKPPLCESCGGMLKPDITFFGDNVPRARVEAVKSAVSESDSLLVLGSSLTVFSGYRIVLQALEEGKNVAIINIGPTRADHLVKLKVSAKCGDILPLVI
ncbi:unnamed protein product [Phaedon cochleariae]|uniref:NAD-dependent protein deacylase n=1 Tax=Phaedon cochleariae TaxID=80249 RepID=A0A9P0DMB0_PHACE|nr:unnamed protein product [Phaedon cochleariae]